MNTETQVQIILNHLVKYGSITSMESFKKYNCTRVSARIYDLRKLGYNISTIYIISKNKDGKLVRYGKYILSMEDRINAWRNLSCKVQTKNI